MPMLEWMAWTQPVAIFFTVIALMLVVMTALEVAWSTIERKGFLPMTTTRGDRLFIGLLGAAFIHLGWLGLTDEPLWWGSLIAGVWFVVAMRWG
jgi:predicted small integral membrane protein